MKKAIEEAAAALRKEAEVYRAGLPHKDEYKERAEVLEAIAWDLEFQFAAQQETLQAFARQTRTVNELPCFLR
jgi:hypothetical protein